jgi:hypothetical protein
MISKEKERKREREREREINEQLFSKGILKRRVPKEQSNMDVM